ncbi:hypothetical protein AR457_39885 [Streptomyces agglomeratus]|uniref:zinc finger domain-containing protein n=1 Tax=Streptomyces agglomeratus TaxID=285458 RepID=UPI00085265A0|nr:hypothetical protein [Streptomyces agglomeratus]OEJ21856.1 hypothetical protein AR457_38565 [Streptomyces agglomeratus]OEJ22057.1 hypothetical protein AR457_39885 [Streptomyces agglomeratus]OEJ36894.1 hypothetical protein BGK70_00540 [Streptomyces agglomeratus]
MEQTPAFPTAYEYALAHRCPTCRAEPGSPCDAPKKNASLARMDAIRERVGEEPFEHDPLWRMHSTRQSAGSRHRSRDIGNAPWPEDRVPGRRYDTLDNVGKSPRK